MAHFLFIGVRRSNFTILTTIVLLIASLTLSAGASRAQQTDDSEGLQREVNDAIAGHRKLALKSGVYHLKSTIVIAPAAGSKFVSLMVEGAGPLNTIIEWQGPSDQSVFKVLAAKLTTLSAFSISGKPALADIDLFGHGSSWGVQLSSIVMDNPARYSVRGGNPTDKTEVANLSMFSVFSRGATKAAFQIENNNNLNWNFYNCSCATEPICVSNIGGLDPGGENGGNFNWFGGNVTQVPLTSNVQDTGAFAIAGFGNYNLIGIRVEDTSTVVYTPWTRSPILINWIGGALENAREETRHAKLINYQAGGNFRSFNSLWEANGTFSFNQNAKSVAFEDDVMRLDDKTPSGNAKVDDFFTGIPKSINLRTQNLSGVKF